MRTNPTHHALLPRLRRIEDQIRGIARMVEERRYGIDVIQQLTAARRALDQASLQVMKGRINTCVSNSIRKREGRRSSASSKIDEMGSRVRFNTRARGVLLSSVICLTVASAPAMAAASVWCRTAAEKACCCCPQGAASRGCSMRCSTEEGAEARPAIVFPERTAASFFKAAYLFRIPGEPRSLRDTPCHPTSLLSREAQAPPPKRYLLACTFRL